MTESERVREKKLAELEREFLPLLVTCLRECARGRYGLFGQNSHLDPEGRYWQWPEASRLGNLAHEIVSIRAEFGEENDVCNRFLQLCSLRGPNVPGEPKLAAEFLLEIGETKA